MKLPIKTFATILGGMALGWVIKYGMMKLATDVYPQLKEGFLGITSYDNAIAIGVPLALAFFIKQPLLRRLFLIAGITALFMEILGRTGVQWPKVI